MNTPTIDHVIVRPPVVKTCHMTGQDKTFDTTTCVIDGQKFRPVEAAYHLRDTAGFTLAEAVEYVKLLPRFADIDVDRAAGFWTGVRRS